MTAPLTALPLDDCRRWALFLDFDGTLVDLAPTPEAIDVPSDLPACLARLAAGLDGAVALVSGRPIADLDRFLGPTGLAAAGQHGLEWRDAIGRCHEQPVDRRRLARIGERLAEFAAGRAGVRVEAKSLAIAMHYRQAPDAETAARALAHELAVPPDLVVQEGKMVLEIKPAGTDKGTALERFLSTPPFAGRRPVFAGDDLTDEHGFAAAQRLGGIAIQVGTRSPTAAGWRADDVAGFRHWLNQVALSALAPPART